MVFKPVRALLLSSAALTLVLAAAGVRRLRRYAIAEGSMEPALSPGDWVIALHTRSEPQRGDIVVVAHPHLADFELVKRVVATSGETVAIGNGRVAVDGVLLKEPWDAPTSPDGRWQVENGDAFLLGDARGRSIDDSRTHGPFPIRDAWRVVFRYWPMARVGKI